MGKKRIIAAGHVCLDITPVFQEGVRVSRVSELLAPGKLIQMGAANVHTGGSVANTGLALKLLGNEVSLMGKVGEDAFGRIVQDLFAAYGAGGLLTAPDCSTSYSVVLAIPGIDRIFLHHPGANDTFSAADVPQEALADGTLFHFGYPPLMRRMYQENGAELAALLRKVRAAGPAVSLDLAAVDPANESGRQDWRRILENVLPYVDFFVPSFEELCFMLDREKYDTLNSGEGDLITRMDPERDALPLAEQCLAMGCGAALIKCGLKGMICRTGKRDRVEQISGRLELDPDAWTDRSLIQRCFRAEVVRSGTGAGDVSIAAFLTAVLEGRDPADCVRLAAAEGAASVSSYDALGGILPLEELEKRIANGEMKETEG